MKYAMPLWLGWMQVLAAGAGAVTACPRSRLRSASLPTSTTRDIERAVADSPRPRTSSASPHHCRRLGGPRCLAGEDPRRRRDLRPVGSAASRDQPANGRGRDFHLQRKWPLPRPVSQGRWYLAPACAQSWPIMDTRKQSRWIDWYGNLEVTPPFTDRHGRRFPYGRMITGKQAELSMHRGVMKFIEAQAMQRPLIIVDVSWLMIGHVDEVVSFVPAKTRQGSRSSCPAPRQLERCWIH